MGADYCLPPEVSQETWNRSQPVPYREEGAGVVLFGDNVRAPLYKLSLITVRLIKHVTVFRKGEVAGSAH
jgi:hypothetical protein